MLPMLVRDGGRGCGIVPRVVQRSEDSDGDRIEECAVDMQHKNIDVYHPAGDALDVAQAFPVVCRLGKVQHGEREAATSRWRRRIECCLAALSPEDARTFISSIRALNDSEITCYWLIVLTNLCYASGIVNVRNSCRAETAAAVSRCMAR